MSPEINPSDIRTLEIGTLHIALSVSPEPDAPLVYLLSPFDTDEPLTATASARGGLSVALVYGMDWDDDLTPWPAPGEPPGSPAFKGDAASFLRLLSGTVIPQVERLLPARPSARHLMGISLSGLFALWQWTQCSLFDSIFCLSGSFWYDGFASWIATQDLSAKTGEAWFLLGDKEASAKVKAFQPVERDTRAIVAHLRSQGVTASLTMVPGTHHTDPLGRLLLALRSVPRRKT